MATWSWGSIPTLLASSAPLRLATGLKHLPMGSTLSSGQGWGGAGRACFAAAPPLGTWSSIIGRALLAEAQLMTQP